MSEGRLRRGYLMMADITGYTKFLTGSELEHAQGIIEDLIKVLLAAMVDPLHLVEIEGDAVFCYAGEHELQEPQLLLDLLERCYLDFSDRLFTMRQATTCRCQACANIEYLDLKIFAHFGQFILQSLAGRDKPSGPDVILLHRLLKNRVREETGLTAYLLATQAFADRIGCPADLREHAEEIEHLGTVECRVTDLEEAAQRRRSERRTVVEAEEADLVVQRKMQASPARIWDYSLDPEKKAKWQLDLRSARMEKGSAGRPGVGSVLHCAHGEFDTVTSFLDWKPFDYLTVRVQFNGPPLKTPPPTRMTSILDPQADGSTLVTTRLKVEAPNVLVRLLVPLMLRTARARMEEEMKRLDELLQADAARQTQPTAE